FEIAGIEVEVLIQVSGSDSDCLPEPRLEKYGPERRLSIKESCSRSGAFESGAIGSLFGSAALESIAIGFDFGAARCRIWFAARSARGRIASGRICVVSLRSIEAR